MADRKKSARRNVTSRKTRRAKPSAPKPGGEPSPARSGAKARPEAEGKTEEKPVKQKAREKTGPRAADSALPVSGEVAFDPGIISDIAIREASEIQGIAELTGGWRTKGVTVGELADDGESGDEGERGYVVDLRIAVEYGVNCVALAETIRSRIGNAIRQMTGRQTIAINVHVTGIREGGLPGEPEGEPHDAGPLGEEHGIDF